MSQSNTTYDELPFPGAPIAQTHPDRLATIATLFGLHPTPPARSRVLEIGCGTGHNLIAIACSLPSAELVGIDLSGRQIEEGRALAADAGVRNVDLRRLDLREADGSLGLFDFVIVHGVYSWVPPDVKERLLATMRRLVASGGLAYLSYNVLPGWRLRSMVRDAMRYRARKVDGAPCKLGRARAFVEELAEAVAALPGRRPEGEAWRLVVQELRGRIAAGADGYVFHEYLEDVNEPEHFHEVAARAGAHGLAYVADAELHTMLLGALPDEVAARVARWADDPIELEQYMDFVRNRAFRHSIFSTEGARPDATITFERLAGLRVASSARREAEPAGAGGAVPAGGSGPAVYVGPRGDRLAVEEPFARAALDALLERPGEWILASDLAGMAGGSCGARPDDLRALGSALVRGHASSVLELHAIDRPFAADPGDRPSASPLARIEARRGPAVTSLRHETVEVEDAMLRTLLVNLDGTRDRGALLDGLLEAVARGGMALHGADGAPIVDRGRLRETLGGALEAALRALAGAGLLAS